MAVKVKQHKGAWWIFIDHHGKRKAKRIGTSKRAADQVAEKIQAKIALGQFERVNEKTKRPFDEYFRNWMGTYARAHYKDSTVAGYEASFRLGYVIVEGERLYGDGVNIAARLESLAEPGGICISGTVYDQVETKLSLQYEYKGEQTVKNLAKPVRVYRVQVEESLSHKSPVKKIVGWVSLTVKRHGLLWLAWYSSQEQLALSGISLVRHSVLRKRLRFRSPTNLPSSSCPLST